MRRLSFVKSAFSLAFVLAAGTASMQPSIAAHQDHAAAIVSVPADTSIVLVPVGSGGSAGAHNIGDSVDFTVKNPVIVNGWVVIPKGAPAHGTISDLTSGGTRGGFLPGLSGGYSQASLHFSFDWVALAAGKLRLDTTPVEVKGRQIKRSVKTMFGRTMSGSAGMDPFFTAYEYGVVAKTVNSVHIATTLHATEVELATQGDTYIDK